MNVGKKFEADFKASVPPEVYFLRLHDSAVGFDTVNSTQRFAPKSPYDAVLCRRGVMYALELKTTSGKSMSFDGSSPNIKERQVEELLKAEGGGAVAGLVLNFRAYGQTYFIQASRFRRFMYMAGKKSISVEDARRIGILIPCRKLKVNYRYDLSVLWREKDE